MILKSSNVALKGNQKKGKCHNIHVKFYFSHQVQVHLQPQQQSNLSQQLQRQQVLSATPAQLSQVKAFVSQAQLQASLSRSNSPLGASVAAAAVQQSIKSSIAAAVSNSSVPSTTQCSSDSVVVTRDQKQATTVQLQASMVSR